jgi:hypothetical protein
VPLRNAFFPSALKRAQAADAQLHLNSEWNGLVHVVLEAFDFFFEPEFSFFEVGEE